MTDKRIEDFNSHQKSGKFHPLTCCSPGEIKECKRTLSYNKRQQGEDIEYSPENEGVLIGTKEYMVCPCGKYKQNWR